MEETLENLDSPNQEEITPESEPKEVGLPADPIEVEPKDDPEEDITALKQKNQELYENNRRLKGFKRDTKTGKWIKPEPKPEREVQGTGDITKTELYSLVKANVPDEDVNEVTIYARAHKVSVTEALKMPEVKAILKVKQEQRASAEASNIRATRTGSVKMSADEILANASKGELQDPETMAAAREAKRLEHFNRK